MNIDNFVVRADALVRDALAKIDANHQGTVFVADAQAGVIGVATDGDIRRSLLEGADLDAPISTICNRDFIWADEQASRELLLKQLDSRIRIIPLLATDRKLVAIVSRDMIPIQPEEPVYARARSPVRVSFGGGGSDLTHYFAGETGAVINSTVSLYSHATLRQRSDSRVVIHSRDLGMTIDAANLDEALENPGGMALICAVLRMIHPEFGIELYLHSDFPMSSGLGGSAVVVSSILGCFNQFRRDQWDSHSIAELAFQAERLHMGVAGGWQDQYATVFGGFNFMEFRMDQNIVHPLRINDDVQMELEESLILCDTGVAHNSGNIHDDQREQMAQSEIRAYVQANVDLTYRMRNHLLRGRLLDFGKGLDEAWHLKRKLSSKISNASLDGHYQRAMENGALGGKLLGAGGGGFFLFYVTPDAKHQLMQSLEDAGLGIRPFRFEPKGLCAWTARERSNFSTQWAP